MRVGAVMCRCVCVRVGVSGGEGVRAGIVV